MPLTDGRPDSHMWTLKGIVHPKNNNNNNNLFTSKPEFIYFITQKCNVFFHAITMNGD